MRRVLRENGLSIVFLMLFLAFWIGQSITGHRAHNGDHTAFLYQKGSAESKNLDGSEPVDRDPRRGRKHRDAPWPVHRGGWILKLYENSLSLALLLFFLVSIVLHAVSGAAEYNEDQAAHGEPERVSVVGYAATSRFWFESFQNWQSEFLSILAMVVLSIFLRQRGSPESKPVDSPHHQTASE